MCLNSDRYMTFCASVITFDSDINDKKPRSSFVVRDNRKIYLWHIRTHTHTHRHAHPPIHTHTHTQTHESMQMPAIDMSKVAPWGLGIDK